METNHEVLNRVFAGVLENLAFMFSEVPEEDDDFSPEGDGFLLTHMGFTGPQQGALSLIVPDSFCTEVAANVLGMDEDDPMVAESAQDTLKEVLNVMCGNLLTEIAGDEPVFDLTIPEVRAVDRAAWDALAARGEALRFLVEDSPVLLLFVIQKAA